MWRTSKTTTAPALAGPVAAATRPLVQQRWRHTQHQCSSSRRQPAVCAAAGRATREDDDADVDSAAAAPRCIRARAAAAIAAAAAAAALLLSSSPAALASERTDADPVFDGANVLRPEARAQLSAALRDLDARTGYRLRIFSQYRLDAGGADAPTPRSIWGSLDQETVVVVVDPSSPNLLNIAHVGDSVLRKLHRPFWTELQSRFGNMFYVRDNGAAAALLAATGALTDCLSRADGCKVVPGLPPEQYLATLWCSIAGGVALGFAARIRDDLQGIVRRRWVWPLLFSPLWGSLFVSFGLGPVVSRTGDIAPLAANTLAFLAAAAAPTLLQRLWDGDDAGEQTPPSTPPPLPPMEPAPAPKQPAPVEQQQQPSNPGSGSGSGGSEGGEGSVANESSA